jgi:hypothetical protein
MRNNTVLVVGCGPAGLLAAWAAKQRGYDPIILGGAQPAKSKLHGAQYLHSKIDELVDESESFQVRYVKHGTDIGYAQKIYAGAVSPRNTSWSKFEAGEHDAYPLGMVYDRLWDTLRMHVFPLEFSGHIVPMFRRIGVARIMSTMPLNVLMPWLKFQSETVLIDDTHCLEGVGYNEIHYYGNQDEAAYRSSCIMGVKSTEYPATTLGVYQECQSVTKPLAARIPSTGALVGAHHGGVDLLGRYGRWKKGALVDDAYRQALEILRQL